MYFLFCFALEGNHGLNFMNFELPNIVSLLSHKFSGTALEHFFHAWENVIFSLITIGIVGGIVSLASRRISLIPGRLQGSVELLVEGTDHLFGEILGKHGKKFVPLIGTLFIYILFMNLLGLIPLMKSSTTSLSTTAALAACAFGCFLYTALKEEGVGGFLYHVAGKPKDAILMIIFMWMFIFPVEFLTVFIRPITLSLRLQGNISSEDLILSLLPPFGFVGALIMPFMTLLALLAAVIQAFVFSFLTTIYLATILNEED